MDTFTQAYIECLEWVEEDNQLPITSLEREEIEKDCHRFQKRAAKYMKGLDESQCGHDFYLTRNGHGSGFWARGYEEKVSAMLCKISKEFGESYE